MQVIFLGFCRHKIMLHSRMFSDYNYTQNPVGLQVLNKNVSFCGYKIRFLDGIYRYFILRLKNQLYIISEESN
jgi:hypothetical protein